jgi:hypothetical protein
VNPEANFFIATRFKGDNDENENDHRLLTVMIMLLTASGFAQPGKGWKGWAERRLGMGS